MSGAGWVILQRELPKLQCIIPSHFAYQHAWYARHMMRVFWLNGLSCIYHGHTAPVIGWGAVFPLIGEALDANGIFAIIGQSPCSSSSNHHCHVFSFLELWCYVEEVALGKKQKSKYKMQENGVVTPCQTFKRGWLVQSIVKLTSVELGVCDEVGMG